MPTPTYALADHLLGGNLAARLAEWRADPKRSYEWIAREVFTVTDGKVDVTYGTVRNWIETLDPEPEAA